MRLAYADPPYLGCAHRYPEHPDSGHWDDLNSHVNLLARLDAEFTFSPAPAS